MNLSEALHALVLEKGCGEFTPTHCGPLEKPHVVISKLGDGWRLIVNRCSIFEMDSKGVIQFRSELKQRSYRD